LISLTQAASNRIRAWSARRHGQDALPAAVHRRRLYILPTRYGLMLAALLLAMLIAGLNYNSNLALAFAFLMVSVALVAMHHCHRNLLGLVVDVDADIDAFAQGEAQFHFLLTNTSAASRRDIEVRCREHHCMTAAIAASAPQVATVTIPVGTRGLIRLDQFELRTRYPFGWFRAWTYVQTPLTIYVAPSPSGERTLSRAAAGYANAWTESRGDEDFAGLRGYEPGIPLKHMAWKVLARGGEPAVRSYSGLSQSPEWLEWALTEGLGVEARLSQLCRWVLDFDAAQRRYGLRLPGVEIPPGLGPAQRGACLRALAQFDMAS